MKNGTKLIPDYINLNKPNTKVDSPINFSYLSTQIQFDIGQFELDFPSLAKQSLSITDMSHLFDHNQHLYQCLCSL